MPIQQHNNYKYHLEMTLAELQKLNAKRATDPNYTDTRIYLSLDTQETSIIEALLMEELNSVARTLANKS